MALPFDATLKDLVRRYARDWLAALGCPGEATLVTPDLSTVSAFADLVFDRGTRLLHLDFQTGADASLPLRMLRYNALLRHEYERPVETRVILLRRQADHSNLNGRLHDETEDGRLLLDFRYEVERVWRRPCEEFLTGGIGLVPVAPLGALPAGVAVEAALAGVVDRLTERIIRETPEAEAKALLTASYILTGLRVPKNIITELFRGARAMRESSAYQAILEEGATNEARRLLIDLGTIRFAAEPEPDLLTMLNGIQDVERLEEWTRRLMTTAASTWREHLAAS